MTPLLTGTANYGTQYLNAQLDRRYRMHWGQVGLTAAFSTYSSTSTNSLSKDFQTEMRMTGTTADWMAYIYASNLFFPVDYLIQYHSTDKRE